MSRPRKRSEKVLSRMRADLLTEIEEQAEKLTLAQAREFLDELRDDLVLMIDAIDNGEVE